MLDFFNKLFKPVPPSGATAKERLRLVLLSDHLSLAPDVVEALKRDLLVVISKYVEIDQAHADVTFEHRDNEVAMLANIPITGVRERRREEPPPPPAASEPLAPEPEPAFSAAAEATSYEAHEARETRDALDAPDAPAAVTASVADATPSAATPSGATPRRRRRRKAAAAKRAAQQQTMALGKPAQA